MTNYAKHLAPQAETPQSEPLPNSGQVQNSAGGYGWAVDDWTRLDRFLILGAEGGTYYATERKLTIENAQVVLRCLKADPFRTVGRIVEISTAGRAPKNDPAIFALSLAAGHPDSPPAAKTMALGVMPQVCRIGTHLFQFVTAVQQFRGWGPALKKAVANWYLGKDCRDMTFQVVKYQQREGYSHRDLLRQSHPRFQTESQNRVAKWITKGGAALAGEEAKFFGSEDLQLIWAFEEAKTAGSATQIVSLINEYGLMREAIPTQWLNDPRVWEALLQKMPYTAMLRNLATMTRVGLFKAGVPSDNTRKVVAALLNEELIKKARVHPVAILGALLTYASGKGVRGQHTWTPVPEIKAALNEAFYKAFQFVQPALKRFYMGCDVSGSMWCGDVADMPGLTPGIGTAAMALVNRAVEPHVELAAFHNRMQPFNLPRGTSLEVAADIMRKLPWGGTDCALPMLDAAARDLEIDTFVIYTDNETWFGNIHPARALEQYRQKTGIPAKLVVVGMTSAGFTIADPNDAGQMDVVGFDTATPAIIADFARG
jgi:60 kDa SS-A/Ro ribonucleoprotein